MGLIIIQQIEMKNSRLCQNCRHFVNDNLSLGKCLLFPKVESKGINEKRRDLQHFLKTGESIKSKSETTTDYIYCSHARNSEFMCGKDGKKYIDK
jgi:hypothetical protein